MNEYIESNINKHTSEIEEILEDVTSAIGDIIEAMYEAKFEDRHIDSLLFIKTKSIKKIENHIAHIDDNAGDIETDCDCEVPEEWECYEFNSFEPIQWNATNLVDKEMMELLQQRIETGITPRQIIDALEKL